MDEHLEQERLEQERIEQERLEQERLEQERIEQERLEQERLEQERLEQDIAKYAMKGNLEILQYLKKYEVKLDFENMIKNNSYENLKELIKLEDAVRERMASYSKTNPEFLGEGVFEPHVLDFDRQDYCECMYYGRRLSVQCCCVHGQMLQYHRRLKEKHIEVAQNERYQIEQELTQHHKNQETFLDEKKYRDLKTELEINTLKQTMFTIFKLGEQLHPCRSYSSLFLDYDYECSNKQLERNILNLERTMIQDRVTEHGMYLKEKTLRTKLAEAEKKVAEAQNRQYSLCDDH